jgi:RHS repeat-associated protein
MIIISTHTSLVAVIRYSFVIALLLMPLTGATSAQGVFDGRTPTGLAPGAPAGSYALSGFENINLFNGHLNFSLPLLKVGGRGSAGYTMMLPIERTWSVDHVFFPFPEGGAVSFFSAGDTDWFKRADTTPYSIYLPGKLFGRNGVEGPLNCFFGTIFGGTLVRLTFIMPNGTEIELRDQLTGGKPQRNFCQQPIEQNHLRGRVFTSADGTGVTFVSDTDIYDYKYNTATFKVSGMLRWPDGARYRIDDSKVSWIEDRNGNRLSFAYGASSFSVTDSMNRQVTVETNVNDVAPYGLCDRIIFKGFGGATRIIRISKTTLGNALRADYRGGGSASCDATALGIRAYQELFPELTPSVQLGCYNPTVFSAVWLPDDGQPSDRTRYQFYYNRYGEMARVELPTGGSIEYDYTLGSGVVNLLGTGLNYGIFRRVTARRVYAGGTTLEGQTVYAKSHDNVGTINVTTTVAVDRLKPDGTLLAREKHYFYGNSMNSIFGSPISYSNWRVGLEYQTEYLGADGATVLRREAVTWQQRAPVSWWPFNPHDTCTSQDCAPPNDPRVTEVVTTLVDTNQVSRQAFAYDQYNNETDVYEYGFGAGSPGAFVRRTHTTYLTNNPNQGNVDYAADLNIHIKNLPTDVSVFDGNGTKVAQTGYVYDAYGTQEFPALRDCPNIVQHNPGFHTGYGLRGNLVKVIRVANFSPVAYIDDHYQYDIAGNVVKKIDSRGAAADFDLSDRFGSPDDEARSNAGAPELAGGFSYAFPTRVTGALDHTAYIQYDYYLGKPVNSEDANGIVSSVAYDDALDRPTQGIKIRYRVGVGVPAERRQTTFTYDDANNTITTTGDLATFNDNVLTAKAYYDGLGRTRRSAAREGATWTITDTQFDALGRVSQVSNPYRAADPDSASPASDLWTKTVYDALGRVVDVESPNGAHVITQHNGSRVTVIDQAGKRRRSELDGLGRLVKVTEDPGGLNYETFYSYDALDNLRQVTQGSQTRTFVYDSLSRLTSATNPESGPMTYAYDPNGNLIEKTDARGVKTTMSYDKLNRVRSKAYSGLTPEGTAAANATPPVNYFYDDYSTLPSGAPTWAGTPSKGRLIGVTYGPGSEGTYYKYDAAGRIVANHQRQGTSNYVTAYTYNLASDVTIEARGNPVRRRNLMAYDAAGRLSVMDTSVFSGAGSDFSRLVSEISYTPFGALQSQKYGNGLIHSMSYNEQLQPVEIRLGRPDNLESVFRLNYIFGTAHNLNGQDTEIALPHNNGNVARIKYFISGTLQYSQTFQYDPLNRIRYAVEHNNGVYNDDARAWHQSYEYDSYGNCGINVDNTSDNVDAANSALRLADFSAANNRITRPGFAYDAAGNLVAESGKNFKYDAEGRIVEAAVAGMGTSQYLYDGNGNRVRKVVGGVATRFEYGVGGELIAERNETNGAVTKEYFYKGGQLLAATKTGNSGEYEYATSDHLGSPRAWTDGSGNLLAGGRHDYLPFGEELFAGYGTRTDGQGYATGAQQDGQRKQFAGYERDAETGQDFAQARYYASAQRRFGSVDPFEPAFELGRSGLIALTSSPQSWNKYSYAYNNPLRFVDRDGRLPTVVFGALIGAAVGGGFELGMQLLAGNGLNWTKIGASTLAGGVSGLIAGATGGVSLFGTQVIPKVTSGLARAGIGVGAEVVEGFIERGLDGDDATDTFDGTSIALDVGFGGAGAVGGDMFANGWMKQQIQKAEALHKRGTINANSGRTSQTRALGREQMAEASGVISNIQNSGSKKFVAASVFLSAGSSKFFETIMKMKSEGRPTKGRSQVRPGLDVNKCGPTIDGCVRLMATVKRPPLRGAGFP